MSEHEVKWQHGVSIFVDQGVCPIDDDFDVKELTPKGITPPTGWVCHESKWGTWHVVNFKVTTEKCLRVVWRRCLKKSGVENRD
jgi:hypothetical protein